jgi:transposase-like protein
MPEITRLTGDSDWIDLLWSASGRPEPLMKLGTQMHLAGLSLSNTISILEKLGGQRSRKAVHDWVHKADLQPDGGMDPEHVALDESVIRVNGQQYWLCAAVDPDTNTILHVRLFSTYTTTLTEVFLSELREKHDVDDAVFLVDDADWLQSALDRHGLTCRYQLHGYCNSVERVFRDVKRRTSSFSNPFSHVDPATAETWLQAFALWHNATN